MRNFFVTRKKDFVIWIFLLNKEEEDFHKDSKLTVLCRRSKQAVVREDEPTTQGRTQCLFESMGGTVLADEVVEESYVFAPQLNNRLKVDASR